jgi:predicted NUDIX family NTP pyrophosphohydrolase
MAKRSAGLLMYRRRGPERRELEVFIAHPGGPLFAKKDAGAWTIPKGEPDGDEDLLLCARREFEEETGLRPEAEAYLPLGEVRQAGGKTVYAWAFEGDWCDRELVCNQVELEWPPRSGRRHTFPEIDRVGFYSLAEAREKLNPAQVALLDRLVARLARVAGGA